MERTITVRIPGHSATDGAGVHLKRIISFPQRKQFDPFLMLDSFGSDDTEPGPGFPWHPHRGIITITYMLKGGVMHEDSMGNSGVITAGGVQWMKAASGVIHQEMPKPDATGIAGLQFWLNLPASEKMSTPDYGDIQDDAFRHISPNEGVDIKVIAGNLFGIDGIIDFPGTEPELYDVVMNKNTEIQLPAESSKQFFILGIFGKPSVTTDIINPYEAYLLSDGDFVTISAAEKCRFLLVGGVPLNEPIAWEGPIVMNTQEELVTAFREYHQGSFVK